jgi:hypothetical protein
MSSDDVDKLISFGQLALEQGWYDKARGYFEQALALDASSQEALKGLARVNEILSRRASTAKGVLMTAKGVSSVLELLEDKIRIRTKGTLLLGTGGISEISLKDITAIQFRKAGRSPGGIEFSHPGVRWGPFTRWSDYGVGFTKEQQPDFERIRAEIEKRIQAESVPSAPSSDADEIAKLADLRDKGILTEEEFQQKKKQILGL